MLMTPWGESLNPNAVLQEYPRPQLRRQSYVNLNGRWDYAITTSANVPEAWDGTILVPFSPECALSGVNRMLHPDEYLWYRRVLTLPHDFITANQRVLLHFGAVDQSAIVYIDGHEVAMHEGGYTAFTADITDVLRPNSVLTLCVTDDTDATWHTRGKQSSHRGGIWYTPQSGIWQTVWAECVPIDHVERLYAVTQPDLCTVLITVFSSADMPCTVTLDGVDYPGRTNSAIRIPVDAPRLWSPETPHLYDYTVQLGDDRVESYFALRTVSVAKDAQGIPRIMLNGKPYFMNGLLDQGYWPDGLYTAPDDEALVFDIEAAKRLGFNMLRKHIKIEPMRWYYHCDRLGMLVWQDMMNGGEQYAMPTITLPLITGIHMRDNHYKRFARSAPEGREAWRRELDEMILQLRDVPSIVVWVPFNEGWGQFDAADAVKRIRAIDATRLIDHASGWHDQGAGDLKSLHVYFKKYRFRPDRHGRAVVLSEFGGYNLRVDGHCFDKKDFGYKRFDTPESLTAALTTLYETEILPAIPQGLCAAVYTQLTDVEDELNGLLTYDRKNKREGA